MGGPQQPSRVVAQLVGTLRVLAQAPDAQLHWLAHYLREERAQTDGSFWVEELGLQFEDAAQATPQFGLKEEQARALAALTEQLSSMRDARRGHLWQAKALASTPEWAEVRRLAARALAALDAVGQS
ncbi:MAG: hypothetical protein ACLPJH_11900 [Myxococcaceae bacterium]